MELVIGDKRYSSWSMRPWLALKATGAPFTETFVKLREERSEAAIRAAGSPSGLVPVLKDGDLTIWDSLAICEYLAEAYPKANLWPQDRAARALGRSACAQMHAGFHSLRGELSMDLCKQESATLVPATEDDVRGVVDLWSHLLSRFGGPFLLGSGWSIADAFFTPVATRFRTYGVRLSDYGDAGDAGAYGERLLENPAFLEWEKGAMAEVG
ncbi:MAG TPA: glutathione S-transferase family protein [Caulobacteraceae bacterium]|jgi:glutathione S-transferase|nr:glutathione S-transferase family protein [Caulobacteraceae bacterium]